MSMLNKIIAAAALSLTLTGVAIAQTAAPAPSAPAAAPVAQAPAPQAPVAQAPAPQAPATAAAPNAVANADDCLKNAFEIAQKAEEKKLSNTDLDKIEELLTTMEGHCDANRFKEAMVVHTDIKSLIETK
ncbi:MAG: hypothetical protein ABL898_00280 [Hyphomicrobiaceae bacterium]